MRELRSIQFSHDCFSRMSFSLASSLLSQKLFTSHPNSDERFRGSGGSKKAAIGYQYEDSTAPPSTAAGGEGAPGGSKPPPAAGGGPEGEPGEEEEESSDDEIDLGESFTFELGGRVTYLSLDCGEGR